MVANATVENFESKVRKRNLEGHLAYTWKHFLGDGTPVLCMAGPAARVHQDTWSIVTGYKAPLIFVERDPRTYDTMILDLCGRRHKYTKVVLADFFEHGYGITKRARGDRYVWDIDACCTPKSFVEEHLITLARMLLLACQKKMWLGINLTTTQRCSTTRQSRWYLKKIEDQIRSVGYRVNMLGHVSYRDGQPMQTNWWMARPW